MSLKSRISDWWAGEKDAQRVVQVQIVELAGTGYSQPVLVHRYEAQMIPHVLAHGRNSLTIWLWSCITLGMGFGLLAGAIFYDFWVFNGGLLNFVVGIPLIFIAYIVVLWLGWGFRYQRGVP